MTFDPNKAATKGKTNNAGKRRWRLPALPSNLPISRSVLSSLMVFSLIVLWVLSGLLSGTSGAVEVAKPISQTNIAAKTFRVVVRVIEAQPYSTSLTLQARTEASQVVVLSAETSGVLVKKEVSKGTFVQKGQVVCHIDVAARQAQLDEARAVLKSRQIEYSAAQILLKKEHVSTSNVASAKAAYDAARATVKVREVELKRTRIAAPFDGIIDATPVDPGSLIMMGMPCATILDKDPLYIVAHVSEKHVQSLKLGAKGTAVLVTGQTAKGTLTYLAESPNPVTRTFKLELSVPNKDLTLRDGITADLQIETGVVQASFIPQGVLTLGGAGVNLGQVGVRVLEDNRVVFRPVKILSDNMGGAYVQGLMPQETVIIVGSEFVRDGQIVEYDMEQSTKQNKDMETHG